MPEPSDNLMDDRPTPDLVAAADTIEIADSVVGKAVRHLAASGGPDVHQVLAYDLAHSAAQVAAARAMLDYGAKGDLEARLTCAFTADMVHDLITRLCGRETMWGLEKAPLRSTHDFLDKFRTTAFVASLADQPGPRHLDSEFEMVQDTFRSFADNEIAPRAEHVHRNNGDVPEDVIAGLAEMGVFGLSVPAEYGGYSEGGDGEYIAMVVATEELSRGSLGIGGSLITRPEILTRALVKGGTEAQKQYWLPKLATAEVMAAVAVTEPDFGSDVAGIKVTATPAAGPDDVPGYVINGVKTWCTFGARADVLMLLARTDPDRTKTHRGLEPLHRSETARRWPWFRVHSAGDRRRHRRQDGGAAHRHARVSRHAQLRDRARQLVGAGGKPHRRSGRARAGVLLPDGRLRERKAADRRSSDRCHAGRLRSRRPTTPRIGPCSEPRSPITS